MAGLVDAGFGYIEGRQIKRAKNLEAQQLDMAAIAREAAGTKEAYDRRKEGERVESNAIAAMAASGGVVEPDIVADIKATTDYNVLSELFAAGEEAKQMNLTARLRRHEGKQAKRLGTAKLVTAIGVEAGKAFMSGGGPTSIKSATESKIVSPTTGVNLNYDQFASYA